jgi:hypothetical protein
MSYVLGAFVKKIYKIISTSFSMSCLFMQVTIPQQQNEGPKNFKLGNLVQGIDRFGSGLKSDYKSGHNMQTNWCLSTPVSGVTW